MKERRRDRQGRFIPLCKGWPASCTVRAQYAVDGYGWYGLYSATKPVYCLTHGRQAVARMNRAGHTIRMRKGYRLIRVEDRKAVS